MYIASQQGQAETLTLLLEKGADVNQVNDLKWFIRWGMYGMAPSQHSLTHT